MLMEDFGDTTFEAALNTASYETAYDQAIDLLVSLHRLPSDAKTAYGPELIEYELSAFIDHYLDAFDAKLTDQDRTAWHHFVHWVSTEFSRPPAVWTHRDFHSRNIMVLGNNSLGLIDFQGALRAPAGYDLASLLRDCYVELPEAIISRSLDRYAESTALRDTTALRRSMDLLGLQRHLKCLGRFVQFDREHGKPRYLDALPRTARYADHVASHYPDAAIVSVLLKRYPVEHLV